MDPYIEARPLWKGIHTQLIGELSTHQLPPLLAPAYYVDAEPSLQVSQERGVYPDVQILAPVSRLPSGPLGQGLAVAEATATIVDLRDDEDEEESAIYIREAGTEQLVTVIEILSYSNKTAGVAKRARYLLKRHEMLNSGVHLVEIDLLRWGQRPIQTLPDQPYHILVSRADERPHTKVWSFSFSDPIPTTPIPLIGPDEYVPLPLQTTLETIYSARNFRRRLDYTGYPAGPLTQAQKEEIDTFLKSFEAE
jgi:hypothetical protein